MSTDENPRARTDAPRINIRVERNPNQALIRLIDDGLGRMRLSDRKASLSATGKVDAIRQIRRGQRPRAEVIAALADVLDVSVADLMAAAGLGASATARIASAPEQRVAAQESVSVQEMDVRAGAGGGTMAETTEVDAPVAEWRLPADLLRGQTTAPFAALRIITVYGDSMEPELPPGTKVIVDTSDRTPSPPGIFAVHDGLGLVLKRVEHIYGSDPPTVRLTSDNPRYAAYERTLDECHLQGRVIGQWRWR